MPGTYWIDGPTKLIMKRYWGVVTSRCVLSILDTVVLDPQHMSGMHEISDLREVTDLEISTVEIGHFAELIKGYNARVHGLVRKAVVTEDEQLLSAAAFFQTLVQESKLEVGVYPCMYGALDFLSIEDISDRARLAAHRITYN